MLWSRWPLGTLTHHRSRGLTVASWSAALGGEEDRRRGAEAEEARARGRKGGGAAVPAERGGVRDVVRVDFCRRGGGHAHPARGGHELGRGRGRRVRAIAEMREKEGRGGGVGGKGAACRMQVLPQAIKSSQETR